VASIHVSIDIPAPPDRVWACIEDIGSHPRWMRDALAIRFVSDQTKGVGTRFDCDTRVGPLRMTDRMEVTEWDPGRAMAIRHGGVVTGEGRFMLEPVPSGTRFSWTERLAFAPYLGGPLAGLVARPVLRRLWRGNLERLRDLVSSGS
jgi:uncharacterized protein YndB with AHSA1/START domain